MTFLTTAFLDCISHDNSMNIKVSKKVVMNRTSAFSYFSKPRPLDHKIGRCKILIYNTNKEL